MVGLRQNIDNHYYCGCVVLGSASGGLDWVVLGGEKSTRVRFCGER